jgi:ABC-type bacteriocin/lantibiotic exporter with double-glycine peptidase domain
MIRRVIRLMHNRKKYFIFAVLCYCILEMVSSVLVPISVRGITNGVLSKDIHMIVISILTYFSTCLSWWILAPICQIILDRNAFKTMLEFKKNLTEHILNLPLKYFDSNPTGEIISKVSADMQCLNRLVSRNLEQVIRKVMGGTVGLIVMAILYYRFALIVFVLGSLSIWASNYFTKKMEAKSDELLNQRANTICNFMEIIQAAKNIRVLKCQDIKQSEITYHTNKEKQFSALNGKISATMNSIIITIGIVTYLAMLFIGCLFVYNSWADWGSVIAIISMKMNTDMLFIEFPEEWGKMKVSIAGVKRLFELCDEAQEVPIKKHLTSKDEIALEMENVSFSYDGSLYVLQNFNMAVAKNTITLIEGESGKGKSTIIKLILGLYNVEEGKLGKILFHKECQDIAYVPQEAELFRDTIYENIACGNNDANLNDVMEAAVKAGVEEFVSKLPKGYETVLTDNGNSLSGGQKQRIALARALVKKADIILLDEVTSALDHDSKERMLETIVQLKKDHTVIFITHDKSIETISDKVIAI